MEKRKLGSLTVSSLGFGGNVLGWTADEKISFRLLDAFREAGGNLIDTADVYSNWVPGHQGGESETIIGAWLKTRGQRDGLVIATKLGFKWTADGTSGLSKERIVRQVEGSLQRLQTDYIDLYQTHYDDEKTPLEETLAAFNALKRAGKVREIGASNYKGPRLLEALSLSEAKGLAAYVSLQPLYNLYDGEEFEKNLQPLCREKGVGVIPYYSLASGFLTGKYRRGQPMPESARAGRMENYLNERGERILAALDSIAATRNSSPTAVALAWLRDQPSVVAPLVSATSTEQLAQVLSSGAIRLSGEEMRQLGQARRP